VLEEVEVMLHLLPEAPTFWSPLPAPDVTLPLPLPDPEAPSPFSLSSLPEAALSVWPLSEALSSPFSPLPLSTPPFALSPLPLPLPEAPLPPVGVALGAGTTGTVVDPPSQSEQGTVRDAIGVAPADPEPDLENKPVSEPEPEPEPEPDPESDPDLEPDSDPEAEGKA